MPVSNAPELVCWECGKVYDELVQEVVKSHSKDGRWQHERSLPELEGLIELHEHHHPGHHPVLR